MLSDAAKEIVDIAEGAFEDGNGTSSNVVAYEIDFADLRKGGGILATLQFKLKKPISGQAADKVLNTMFPLLEEVLENKLAADVANALILQQGLEQRIGKDIQGDFDIKFLDTITEEVVDNTTAIPRTASGRFSSKLNLKASLELLMKENMLQVMTGSSAGTGKDSPLKNRTGRFVNSTQVAEILVPDKPDRPMSIYYRYMVYPYQVFDPKHTQSPQKGLASYMRNPQRIIGEALVSAARTLLGRQYKVIIRQVI